MLAQDSTGPADHSHALIPVVLVLQGPERDAAQGGPGILVHGGSHIGGGPLSLAGSLLRYSHHTFAGGPQKEWRALR